MDYQAIEGALQSVAFRITAQPPPAGEITVFSTMDGTAAGMTIIMIIILTCILRMKATTKQKKDVNNKNAILL